MKKNAGSGSESALNQCGSTTLLHGNLLTWNVLEDLAASCDGETSEQGDAARHPGDLGIYSSRVRGSNLKMKQ
jgi:hypothetical protein